jgi:hypothetical protein
MGGGHSNSKIFHCVNWSTVSSPLANDGLAIKNPHVVNLTMGAKILWHLISG